MECPWRRRIRPASFASLESPWLRVGAYVVGVDPVNDYDVVPLAFIKTAKNIEQILDPFVVISVKTAAHLKEASLRPISPHRVDGRSVMCAIHNPDRTNRRQTPDVAVKVGIDDDLNRIVIAVVLPSHR
jgi:hypothetical protein